MFQGKLTADVVPQGDAPHFVTFQIGAFRADQAARGASAAPVRAITVSVDASSVRQKPEAPFRDAHGDHATLDEVIVDAWERLTTARAVRCPVCSGEMLPTRDVGEPGGRCGDCGARLS